MKIIVSSLIVLLGLGLLGCGGAHAVVGVEPLPQLEVKTDAESDGDSYPGEVDNDRNPVFGHRASRGDRQAITQLVRSYAGAAAADDGPMACASFYASLKESVVQDYGRLANAPGRGEGNCAIVMSNLFKRERSALGGERTGTGAVAVRVRDNEASAQFRPRRGKVNYLLFHRERGAWKVDMAIPSQRPISIE